MTDRARKSCAIPTPLHTKIRTLAAAQHMSVTTTVVLALEAYIASHPLPPPPKKSAAELQAEAMAVWGKDAEVKPKPKTSEEINRQLRETLDAAAWGDEDE